MSDRTTDASHDVLLQRALATMRALRKRVEELESERSEPIAIIGMACRFPGPARDLDGYWDVLEGANAFSRLDQRFDASALRGIPPHAGLLPAIADFDPTIFGMSPKEAASLDPQQRLLLELSWEALEHAGYAPTRVRAQPTGVFVGMASTDFRDLLHPSSDALDSHCATGTANCLAPGRIAYTLGLEGPAMVVDTGCSASLVAVHLGCQSLRQGESRLALAGGVNIIAAPLLLQLMARTGVLSPTGECRPFDAGANGFVRGEGGGIVVLKRLRDAVADRDPVLAVIRGSAVNQDGRSSNLTAPNVDSQIQLLRTSLRNAGVDPSRLTYLEAMGTGTSLGDPIEIEALREVIGETEGPRCYVGSVKGNVGHLEAAAGMASLIRVVLSMRHRRIPRQANFDQLNPHISLDGTRLAIATEPVAWTHPEPLVAGVSGLSMSGTNAHLVIEEPPARPEAEVRPFGRTSHVLALSARSPQALAELAARVEAGLAAPDAPPLADACYTAGTGRVHFRHRAALVASSTPAMVARLRALAGEGEGVIRGEASLEAPVRVGFLFGGEHAAGTGRGLRDSFPEVRRALESCDEILRPLLGGSLLEAMDSPASAPPLPRASEYARAAVFAIQYAIARLWMSWGIEPVAVAGEGVGAHAAACIAGALTLEEALRLAALGSVSAGAAPRVPIVAASALAGGCTVVVEMGPAIAAETEPVKRLASLGQDDQEVMLESLAALYADGAEIDWEAFDSEYERRRVALPTYPFQRKRLWLVPDVSLPAPRRNALVGVAPPETLFDRRVPPKAPAAAVAQGAWDLARVEALILEAVSRVMRMEPAEIDVHEPLQSLGLDSLMTLKLRARLRDASGVSLPLVAFLKAPSIASLAAHLLDLLPSDVDEGWTLDQPSEATQAFTPIEPRPAERHEPFGMTDLQQAYLIGRSNAFELGNVSTYFHMEYEVSNVDLARLEWAFQRLIERHDMLRAVVLPDGTQRVLDSVPPYRIRVTDLRALDTDSRERELLAMRRELSDRTFDTSRWPLYEVRATRTVGNRVRLHMGIDVLFVDGWSASLLFREWSAIYQGQGETLPALSLTYRDYVNAVTALEETEPFARAMAYWQGRLASLPPPPDLPLARNPASIRRPRFTHRQGRLDAAAWSRFKRIASRSGLTISAAVCTVYAEIMAAWSKSSSFTLNLLSLNRLPLHPQVSSVVGNFSATTLLEVEVRAGESFTDGARRLQHQLWSDLQHGVVNGVRVLRELNRTQKNAARAAMPVVFASVLNSGGSDGHGEQGVVRQLSGLGSDPREVHFSVRTPQVWIDHQVLEDAGELVLNWDVVEELFPDGMVADAFTAYLARLEQLAADEAAWSAPAYVAAPSDQLEVRSEINRTAAPMREALLHDPFLERVAEAPDRVAVISPARTLGYGELDLLSERVAAWLRGCGTGPGRLVAITMEKGWEQVVAALAVVKAGAAYVPVDPGLPHERLLHLLRHTEAECVLTQSHVEARIEWPAEIRRLAVDECDGLPDPIHRMQSPARPDDLAYVIYTSGSTGLPKGVMIEHRSALNTILDINERLKVTPADRVLGLSSLSFDLSVYDVFGMLAAGGALVLPGPADAREPARWLAQVVSSRVTLWNTVPALMEMLVDHVIASGGRDRLPLRAVMMSGDWIPINLPARIALVAPRARCLSLGGATEASIWSISYPIERIDPAWTSVPYGVPMRNQRFEVLDAAMRPRPVWVPGDLYIAGEGLARGYWSDEERTAKSFFFHPFTGERLYRTGDLGRYLPDGNIEFLGRADFQVKIGGYRIELGEIEAAMSQLAGVRNAVAVATGERGARRLLAYVAPEPGASLTEEGILSALRAKIPGYAVPQRVLLLDALPLSANGKVDRRALPEPGAAHAERALVAPRNDTERALVDCWRELLGQERIGVADNFFDLGGQSLLAVRLMGLIQQRWGATLPLATLFEHPTVEALARLVGADAAPGASDRTALVALRSSGSEAPLFFAHPVGGDVLCYADLAAAFDPGQPFYGLQAVDSAEPAGIAEMAAHHVSAIRERQPSGPYRLGGWSMGGVLAYEMAQQLRRAGERVELLALVDVSMSPTGARRDIDDAWLLAAFAHDLAGVSRHALTVDDTHLRTLAPSERMAHVLDQAHACGVLPPEIDADTLAVYFERFRRNYRAMLAYQAQQYGGRLLFLRARDGASPEIARGWGALAAAADVIDVDGDHYAICRRDGARVIAGLLAARLRRAAVSPTPTGLEAIRVEPRDSGVLGAQEVPAALRSSRPGLI